MKNAAIGIAVIAALMGTSAWAADMAVKAPPAPVAAPYSWTGFYLGGAAGAGWSDETVNYAPNDPAVAELFSGTIPGFIGEQPVVSSYRVRQSGSVGGLEAGYNWQAGSNWLWGLEADFSFSGMDGQATGTSLVSGPPAATFLQTITAQQSTDWYGTVRGRLGWLATPNLLLFGTGGLAYGRVADSANYTSNEVFLNSTGGFSFSCTSNNVPCFSGSSSAIKTGWTAGGGLEWLLDHHWSAKIEYQVVDLGTETVRVTANTLGVPGTTLSSFNAAFRDQFQVVRLGLNYHF